MKIQWRGTYGLQDLTTHCSVWTVYGLNGLEQEQEREHCCKEKKRANQTKEGKKKPTIQHFNKKSTLYSSINVITYVDIHTKSI